MTYRNIVLPTHPIFEEHFLSRDCILWATSYVRMYSSQRHILGLYKIFQVPPGNFCWARFNPLVWKFSRAVYFYKKKVKWNLQLYCFWNYALSTYDSPFSSVKDFINFDKEENLLTKDFYLLHFLVSLKNLLP